MWRPFAPLRCDTPLHDCIKLLCIVDSSRTWGGFPFFDAEKRGCRKPRDTCSLGLVGLPTTSPRVLLSLQLRFPALTFQWNKHIHETVGVQNPRMFLWLTRPPPSCVVVWPVSVGKLFEMTCPHSPPVARQCSLVFTKTSVFVSH